MIKVHSPILNHIAHNKQIALASIILSLAAIFVFSIEDRNPAVAASMPPVDDSFVNKTSENAIQPADIQPEAYTQTDSIIYENSMGDSIKCENILHDYQNANSSKLSAGEIRVPILMYHYIEIPGSTTLPWLYNKPDVFESQLKTLSNDCYQSAFVSEVADAIDGSKPLPPKSIAITFDDGYEDMYTNAFPLLKKYGMKGTMYIIVNALDKPGYLTQEQVKEMSDSGYVEIAAHTMNHPDLTKKNWEVAHYEIAGSKITLEKIIGKPVTDFAYPYGFFTAIDEGICLQAGYHSCASTYPGQVQTFSNRFSLYRLRPGYRVGSSLVNWLELSGPKI
jgi:peptidoglycan/xylan/chitin deacetylase (PgdA/CDA1 family)